MPYSYDFFNDQVKEFVDGLTGVNRILDVGPGAGKYGKLLKKEGRVIEAVEVFEPYISKYKLQSLYDLVHHANVLDFPFLPKQFDLVVMGDILEHLTVEQATALLSDLHDKSISVLVLVPYNYRQGKSHGNDHEEHEQDDLTESVFLARYPGFKKVMGNKKQGVFYHACSL